MNRDRQVVEAGKQEPPVPRGSREDQTFARMRLRVRIVRLFDRKVGQAGERVGNARWIIDLAVQREALLKQALRRCIIALWNGKQRGTVQRLRSERNNLPAWDRIEQPRKPLAPFGEM